VYIAFSERASLAPYSRPVCNTNLQWIDGSLSLAHWDDGQIEIDVQLLMEEGWGSEQMSQLGDTAPHEWILLEMYALGVDYLTVWACVRRIPPRGIREEHAELQALCDRRASGSARINKVWSPVFIARPRGGITPNSYMYELFITSYGSFITVWPDRLLTNRTRHRHRRRSWAVRSTPRRRR
jgi:hypothetical protein